MNIEKIKVPDIGGAEGVEVIEICVAVGDQVSVDDSLVVLESDKASMEVPSTMAGTVKAISIADGDSLSEGDVILELETGAVTEPETQAAEQPQATEAAVPEAPPVEEPQSPSEPQSSTVEVVQLPDLGGATDVDVIEVCVAVGDEVAEGDSLLVLETDKASMDVPAPKEGKVTAILVQEGDQVSEGADIVQMEVSASGVTPAPQAKKAAAPAPANAPTKTAQQQSEIPTPAFTSVQPAAKNAEPVVSAGGAGVYAGPAVRRLAREMGVDLSQAKGTGPKGRISKSDLKAHVKSVLTNKASGVQGAGTGIPAVPDIDFAKFGEVNIEPLTKIHKLTAANMQRNWLNVPHVTQFDEADITELEAFRQSLKAEAEQRGVKITPLPFLLKACAVALQAHPKFNASLHADGEHMVYKRYVHIGMAVDTPAGLVVPVLRDVDKKSIWQLAAETAEVAQKAKERKLKPDEMQGGCFTISSLGGIGGQGFTPIVNAPEVAILGISKLATKPVWDGNEFVPRKMLPMALSYDHRAINGGDGGRFFTYLAEILSDIRKLVL